MIRGLQRRTKDPDQAREEVEREIGKEAVFDVLPLPDQEYLVAGYAKADIVDELKGICTKILAQIEQKSRFEIRCASTYEHFTVTIISDDSGLFIGRHGRTLDALEVLVSCIFNKGFIRHKVVELDIDNYWEKRQAYLLNMAKVIVRDVETHRREKMIPNLLPRERKIIHSYLSDHHSVTTESKGVGSKRVLIIKPKKRGNFNDGSYYR